MSETKIPADVVMHCLACDKEIPATDYVCSKECGKAWTDEQTEAERELERAERERDEDPNAGCWSYSW